MDAAESLCPHVMKRSNLRTELVKASSAKMMVPKSFVTKTLLEQSGVDIINKIRCVCVMKILRSRCSLVLLPDHITLLSLCTSEVKLSLASFLSDRIVDEILEALSTSQLTLVGMATTNFSATCSLCAITSALNSTFQILS